MSPFKSKGAKTYKGRVRDRDGVQRIRSLGTKHKAEAALIEAWCEGRYTARDWRTVDAIAAGLSPARAYFAAQEGRLGALLDAREAQAAEDAEADLDTLVTEWAQVARSDKYVRQVRAMIPEGRRFGVGGFTRAAVSKFLHGLACGEPTKNRYRVALSQFARWLVERDVLPANPVRDVRGFRENDPRMVHYTRTEAQRLLALLPSPECVAEALMCGAGLEWGAVKGLHRRDIDLTTREVVARGTKTRWRNRTVRVLMPDCWQIVLGYVDTMTPHTPLFPGLTERRLLTVHKAACDLAGVAVSTLHDWRHTFAIQALKDGYAAQVVKHQLGHSPHSTMLERVYGAWIPKTDEDYTPRFATNPATSARKTGSKGGR